MPLGPGQMLSHYRLAEKIGEGGMGFVWRAEDTVLGREVALKFLPAGFDSDPDRLARFEREARFLASLNHSNIAAIHGLEEAEGQRFLVLELVPGMSLEERIGKGVPPLETSLKIARDIALALEAAHEKGVIHRDLKPGNVQVTPKGEIKVLDFGLAKAFGTTATADDSSQQLTMSMGTGKHTVLGTTPYMSPEQASAGPLDKRTDIWAFGCILYQLLTGRRAFYGETVSSTIVAIHGQEPRWQELPDEVPPRIHELLRRCLTKDPDRRLHDIADARIEIEDAMAGRDWVVSGGDAIASVPTGFATTRGKLVFGALGLLAGAILTALVFRGLTRSSRQQGRSITRTVVTLPQEQRLLGGGASVDGMSSPIALSPDGTRLVYTAESSDGTQLYVRSLDRFDARPIPGTEDAFSPFLSPDGQWVGFFARNELRKVSLASGAQFKICDTPSTSQSMSTAIQGASWGPDGTIVFAAGARSWGSPSGTASGLFSVSSDGGVAEALASPDEEQGERGYWWPQILPDDLGVLFTVWGTATGDSRIELLSLDTGETRTLLHEGSGGRYLPTGHLVFSQDAQLVAVPFDTAGLEVTGPPMPVPEDIYTSPRSGLAYFTVSATGSLAYVPGTFSESVLMLVDGEGKAARIVSEGAAGFVHPRFSPDGRRIAADAFVAGKRDIWVYEIERGTRTRLTVEGTNRLPVWTRDGNHITYGSTSTGSWELLSAPADGSGEARSLLKGNHNPISWSPDDRALALAMLSTEGGRDIWVLPAGGEPKVFLATAFDERSPTFSPDGRWLVYVSDESGRDEVYVRPYPGTGVRGKWPVSSEGGREPVWSASGGELFYRNGNWMMAVAVETDPTFRLGKPRRLFEAEYYLDRDGHPAYGVSPDGKFVMVEDIQQKPTQVRVVLNWFEELADLAPTSSR